MTAWSPVRRSQSAGAVEHRRARPDLQGAWRGCPGGADQALREAVLSACDATDGLKDGVVTDPRRCAWKPESLACKAGEAGGSCLTHPQVDALNAVYRTVRTPSGVVGNYGLTRGSEMGWNPLVMPTTPGAAQLPERRSGRPGPDVRRLGLRSREVRYSEAAGGDSPHGVCRGIRGDFDGSEEILRRGGKLSLARSRRCHHRLLARSTTTSAVKANGGSDIRLLRSPAWITAAVALARIRSIRSLLWRNGSRRAWSRTRWWRKAAPEASSAPCVPGRNFLLPQRRSVQSRQFRLSMIREGL